MSLYEKAGWTTCQDPSCLRKYLGRQASVPSHINTSTILRGNRAWAEPSQVKWASPANRDGLPHLNRLLVKRIYNHGAEKVRACHSGKLQLTCTSPRVILKNEKKKLDEQDWLQFFCNVNFPQKIHLPVMQVKNRIRQPNSKIYQFWAIRHDFLCTLVRLFLQRLQQWFFPTYSLHKGNQPLVHPLVVNDCSSQWQNGNLMFLALLLLKHNQGTCW